MLPQPRTAPTQMTESRSAVPPAGFPVDSPVHVFPVVLIGTSG